MVPFIFLDVLWCFWGGGGGGGGLFPIVYCVLLLLLVYTCFAGGFSFSWGVVLINIIIYGCC